MNNSEAHFFSLLLKKTDGESMTYRFAQEATVGSDPRNDIILMGPHLTPKYLHFKMTDGCLALTFLGRDESASLNRTLLQKNKMYILEKKDVIQIGFSEITIL